MSDRTTIAERTVENVLHELPRKRIDNQSIAHLASGLVYIFEDTKIFDVQAALRSRPDLQAVGVVDENEKVLGLVIRRDFFATMARPYAQDVFKNHPIREIMAEPRLFSGDANLFSVAEDIDEDLRRPGITYYVLTYSQDRFAGVFSSQDMLLYLSHQTQRDINLARTLQSRIVREREFVTGSRLELFATSRTAKGVGGDFYNVREYAPGRWLIAMCDVSGKGIAASIISSALWGMMSIYDFRAGMVPFIKQLNSYLVRTFESEKFVTAVFLDYDESTGEVQICDLGHSHLFMYRNEKLLSIKSNQNNLPMGIVADIEPKVGTFVPHQDDLIFVITDGLIEQENLSGDVYSLKQISSIFDENRGKGVELISDRLMQNFERFRGKRPLTDDVSWALMRFVEQEITL